MGGILVTDVLKVGVNAALWGTFLRHYVGISNHWGCYPGSLGLLPSPRRPML